MIRRTHIYVHLHMFTCMHILISFSMTFVNFYRQENRDCDRLFGRKRRLSEPGAGGVGLALSPRALSPRSPSPSQASTPRPQRRRREKRSMV